MGTVRGKVKESFVPVKYTNYRAFNLALFNIYDTIIYVANLKVCACSSEDRAPASGAGSVGSIPIRRTKQKPAILIFRNCRFFTFTCCRMFKCSF